MRTFTLQNDIGDSSHFIGLTTKFLYNLYMDRAYSFEHTVILISCVGINKICRVYSIVYSTYIGITLTKSNQKQVFQNYFNNFLVFHRYFVVGTLRSMIQVYYNIVTHFEM